MTDWSLFSSVLFPSGTVGGRPRSCAVFCVLWPPTGLILPPQPPEQWPHHPLVRLFAALSVQKCLRFYLDLVWYLSFRPGWANWVLKVALGVSEAATDAKGVRWPFTCASHKYHGICRKCVFQCHLKMNNNKMSVVEAPQCLAGNEMTKKNAEKYLIQQSLYISYIQVMPAGFNGITPAVIWHCLF